MEPNHWALFLEMPKVAKLWEEYLAEAWAQWMWQNKTGATTTPVSLD